MILSRSVIVIAMSYLQPVQLQTHHPSLLYTSAYFPLYHTKESPGHACETLTTAPQEFLAIKEDRILYDAVVLFSISNIFYSSW